MERSLHSLTKACVEGVNVAVLALGSGASRKSALLFEPIRDESVVTLVFQALLASLEAKASAINNTSNSGSGSAAASDGGGGAKKKQGFAFELSVSFVEFYEETMTDLLVANDEAQGPYNQIRPLVVEDSSGFGGKALANLSEHGPISSVDDFHRLLEVGKRARRNDSGLYGNAREFSSAILRISLKQTFRLPDASKQELHSTLSIVDLPATNRLARPGGAVRLSEGPLLNKALFAFADVLDDCSQVRSDLSDGQGGRQVQTTKRPPESDDFSYPSFDDSHLTAMLHDVLGGNCLTFALLCLAPNDFQGSKATIQLGNKLPRIENFPIVNNDMLQGLLRRHFLQLTSLKASAQQAASIGSHLPSGSSYPSDNRVLAYERKLHELEGKLAQETLEKRLVREDKEKLVLLMNELKTKYNELFDNEIDVRKELLACEQEKLALSKAFVQFEIEKNTTLQELDSDRFEIETKLIQAEQMVLEIQQDDSKKVSQIQDLIAKMSELIREKTAMSEELSLLQTHAKQSEQQFQKEAKKNQQLSLELLVAVNQKHKAHQQLEGIDARNRELATQLEEIRSKSEQLRVENVTFHEKTAAMNAQIEQMRRELVLKELEAEKLHFHSRNNQIDQESEATKLNREYEVKLTKLTNQLETAVSACASERKAFELQFERLTLDLTKSQKEKEELVHSWMTKLQENEELLVANERLVHESESQIEAHRLKIVFLASSKDNLENDSDSGSNSSMLLLRELIASYQVHEKQLRSQLAQLRSKSFRLEKRLRERAIDFTATATGSVGDQKLGLDASFHPEASGVGDGDVSTDEKGKLMLLLQEINTAQAQIALEKEKHTSSVLKAVELEKKNQFLTLECDALKLKLEQSHDEEKQHVDAIRVMHEALLKQLEEVRARLIQQQTNELALKQQQSVAGVAKKLVGTQQQQKQLAAAAVASSALEANNHAAWLAEEKQRLEVRLAASTRQWTTLVEQVERRCAELLTKNVMLVQENSDLREHLKVRTAEDLHKCLHKLTSLTSP